MGFLESIVANPAFDPNTMTVGAQGPSLLGWNITPPGSAVAQQQDAATFPPATPAAQPAAAPAPDANDPEVKVFGDDGKPYDSTWSVAKLNKLHPGENIPDGVPDSDEIKAAQDAEAKRANAPATPVPTMDKGGAGPAAPGQPGAAPFSMAGPAPAAPPASSGGSWTDGIGKSLHDNADMLLGLGAGLMSQRGGAGLAAGLKLGSQMSTAQAASDLASQKQAASQTALSGNASLVKSIYAKRGQQITDQQALGIASNSGAFSSLMASEKPADFQKVTHTLPSGATQDGWERPGDPSSFVASGAVDKNADATTNLSEEDRVKQNLPPGNYQVTNGKISLVPTPNADGNFTLVTQKDQYGNSTPVAKQDKHTGAIIPLTPDEQAAIKSGSAALGSAGGSSLPPGSENLHGNEFLAVLPPQIAGQVKAIVEGRAPYPTGMAATKPINQQIAAYVQQVDPTFETGNAGSRVKVRNEFNSGGPSSPAGMITAGNTAIQHLGHLSDLAEQLDNADSGVPGNNLYNQLGNAINQSRGRGEAVTQFNNTLGKFAEEVTKFYRGTGGTESDIQRDLNNLNSNMSPSQLRAAIQTQVDLLQGKINALQDRWHQGMGPLGGDFPIIQPDSQGALDRIANRAGVAPKNSSAPVPAAAPPVSAAASGNANNPAAPAPSPPPAPAPGPSGPVRTVPLPTRDDVAAELKRRGINIQ